MKNLKEKFKNKINFVKPLYKKVYPNLKHRTKLEFVSEDIDNREKLCGDGVNVKKNVVGAKSGDNKVFYKRYTERYNIVLPGACQRNIKADFNKRNNCFVRNIKVKKLTQANDSMIGVVKTSQMQITDLNHDVHKLPDTWLKVYPAPILPKESLCSIILRCFMCQIGLCTFLFFWTIIWVLVIHHFEEPFERKVSMDFKDSQNQLVIDLATELRQITPLSPKWRNVIEERIEAERQLTIAAVGRGARLHPGHFWDVAGTFLFSVYVMTALGFGAPVPQTLWGRTATLIYAIVAVPTHIYLMVHLSTCVVVRVEYCVKRLRVLLKDRLPFQIGKNIDNKTDNKRKVFHRAHLQTDVNSDSATKSPNCSRNSEIKPNRCKLRKRIICILGVLCIGRGAPLAMALYYVLGLTTFGIARSKQPLEVVMFPLEFTTTGGLEHVECYVRMLYGIYVEGAMILLSCALATLRRHSTGPVNKMADRYRLFSKEKYSDSED